MTLCSLPVQRRGHFQASLRSARGHGASAAYLRTGCASLLRGTGIPPAEGALGLGKPLLITAVPAGLVRVALLILLGGFAGTMFWTRGGPGDEVVCVSCVVSWLPGEPEPWLLNAFTGCRRAKGDGAAGERNLPGEGTAEWQGKWVFSVETKYKLKPLLYMTLELDTVYLYSRKPTL